jgi:nicotinate-nucleotide--dimethylbenzimidazole phosphoribosyltransferase
MPTVISPQPVTASRESLAELRSLITNDLPPLQRCAVPPVNLGDLGPLWRWLADAQHKARPAIRHPRLSLFMAEHGAHLERQRDLPHILSGLQQGSHPAAAIAREANADLQVYDLSGGPAARNFLAAKALEETEAAQAVAYGMMSVQPGVDLLVLSALNPVAEDAAAGIEAALQAGLDPLDSLLRFGGLDIAAMLGAAATARLAKIPVLLDGKAAEIVKPVLAALKAGAADHAMPTSAALPLSMALPPPVQGALLVPLLKSIVQLV